MLDTFVVVRYPRTKELDVVSFGTVQESNAFCAGLDFADCNGHFCRLDELEADDVEGYSQEDINYLHDLGWGLE